MIKKSNLRAVNHKQPAKLFQVRQMVQLQPIKKFPCFESAFALFLKVFSLAPIGEVLLTISSLVLPDLN